jgi:hypothetical protein
MTVTMTTRCEEVILVEKEANELLKSIRQIHSLSTLLDSKRKKNTFDFGQDTRITLMVERSEVKKPS